MGYLPPERQIKGKLRYYTLATCSIYMCDWCFKPISINQVPVIDKRKGYYKPVVPKGCRTFIGRQPKVTYHPGACDQTPFGIKQWKKRQRVLHKLKQLNQGEEMPKTKKDKSKKEKSTKKEKKSKKKVVKAEPKVMKAVLALITKKDNHYTKGRLIDKLKGKFEKPEIRVAISALWSEGKIRKDTGKLKYYLYEKKRGKEKDSSDASSD